ncbi:MAG: LamG domain-containing protein [bacterium]
MNQNVGDKLHLYYPMYKLSISPSDLDLYSDRYIKFHSDSNEDAAVLDADTGHLTLEGRVKSASAVVGATNNPVEGYSLVADSAWIGNLAGGGIGGSNSGWTVDGSNMYSAVEGNVGIGTSVPSEKLEINGVLSLAVQSASPEATAAHGKIYALAKPAFDSTLLLHMDGADGSTSFTDSSSNGHNVAVSSDAQIDTAESVFGGASGLFNQTDDCLVLANSDDWKFQDDDFTVDCWVNIETIGQEHTIWNFTNDDGYGMDLKVRGADNKVYCFLSSNGTTWDIAGLNDLHSSTVLSTDQWYHVAVVRDGVTARLFLNGIEEDTHSVGTSSIYIWSASAYIGARFKTGSIQDEMDGHLDEFRVSTGTARWTSNFTPPTQPYDPSGQSLFFRDFQGAVSHLSAWEIQNGSISYSGGHVGIGTTEPGRALEIASGLGNARSDGWDTWSARELKKDIVPVDRVEKRKLAEGLRNTPLSFYRYKKESPGARLRLGLLVEDAPPSIVSEDRLSISLSDSIGFLFAVLQDQDERIRMLEHSLQQANIPISTPTVTPAPTSTPSPTATPIPESATGTIEEATEGS